MITVLENELLKATKLSEKLKPEIIKFLKKCDELFAVKESPKNFLEKIVKPKGPYSLERIYSRYKSTFDEEYAFNLKNITDYKSEEYKKDLLIALYDSLVYLKSLILDKYAKYSTFDTFLFVRVSPKQAQMIFNVRYVIDGEIVKYFVAQRIKKVKFIKKTTQHTFKLEIQKEFIGFYFDNDGNDTSIYFQVGNVYYGFFFGASPGKNNIGR